jgi:hypothetical protein
VVLNDAPLIRSKRLPDDSGLGASRGELHPQRDSTLAGRAAVQSG